MGVVDHWGLGITGGSVGGCWRGLMGGIGVGEGVGMGVGEGSVWVVDVEWGMFERNGLGIAPH